MCQYFGGYPRTKNRYNIFRGCIVKTNWIIYIVLLFILSRVLNAYLKLTKFQNKIYRFDQKFIKIRKQLVQNNGWKLCQKAQNETVQRGNFLGLQESGLVGSYEALESGEALDNYYFTNYKFILIIFKDCTDSLCANINQANTILTILSNI